MDAVDVIDNAEQSQNDEDTVEVCRVCLISNHIMRDLFVEGDVISLSTKAMSFASVKILPGDGLPAQVCCECADKLEAAYEFKLQVEQADSFLRAKYDSLNIKEELFFNEVEVRLENERHDEITEVHHDVHYDTPTENLNNVTEVTSDKSSTLLKDHLALLQVEKLAQNEYDLQAPLVENSGHMQTDEQYIQTDDENDPIINEQIHNSSSNETDVKDQTMHDEPDGIAISEHNYMVQQGYNLSSEQEQELMNQQHVSDHDTTEYLSMISEEEQDIKESENHLETIENQINEEYIQEKVEATQQEIRKSKRKLMQNNDADEENYFENLNLSSRLSHSNQVSKEDKIFFMCYLCDKQFLSKDILKEHMHSHEEVRQTLSLKKTPDKSIKSTSSIKGQPPSGKKANKCPYCGKEYLYVISFKKHIKQHQSLMQMPNDNELKDLVDSLLQDDNSFDSNNFDNNDTFEIISSDKSNLAQQNNQIDIKVLNESTSQNLNKRNQMDVYFDNSADHLMPDNDDKFIVKQQCNICELEFDCLEKLKEHQTTHVIDGVMTATDLDNICQQDIKKDNKRSDNVTYNTDTRKESNDLKCPNCSLLFGSKRSLAKHLETHEGVRYRCKICGEEFTHKDYLRKHAEQHTRVKSYKCTECSIIFANELTLRNHLIATNHKTTIRGEEYDPNKRIKRVAAKAAQKIIDKYSTEEAIEDSEKDDDNDDFMVKQETNNTSSNKILPGKKISNKKNLECETCGKRCISKQALSKHMEYHMKNEKSDNKNDNKIKSVPEVKEPPKSIFDDRHDDDDDDDDDDFDGGLDWPMDNHECSTCKKRYSTKKSLLRHQLLHEEPNFECDICNVKFYRKDKLKAHYDKCSEKNPNQVRKCNICGDTFENNEILREHRSKHVDEGILTEEDLRELEPGSEERRANEKVARKRRTDIVGLECTECNKQYTSRKGLLRHIQVHEGKKYLCDICPKKFYRREHLKIHVAKHNMVKPYKCTRCSKRFIKEEQLAAHITKHERNFKKNKESDGTAKRFLCEICSKSFTQSTTLVAHLRAHNGIKPYVCEVCARPFTTNAYLKMHMRTHTQERPYSCKYCGRAFARADTLANHLTSHTGEAKYHCKYCPKHFRRLKSLKEHVFIHTGQRPYACPTCDRRFNNNGSRYAHSKRCKQNMADPNRPLVIHATEPLTLPLAGPPATIQTSGHRHTAAQIIPPTMQVVQTSKNIKTITITRPPDQIGTHQVMQHQEILMPLILPLTVTLTDVDEEVILPEGTKIFTTT